MKKTITIFLSLFIILSLSACRNSSGQTEPKSAEEHFSASIGSPEENGEASKMPSETETEPEIDKNKADDPTSFVQAFSQYFFSGDMDELEKCLTDDYQDAVVCYTGETAGDISIRTIAPIEDDDSHLFASVQFVAGNEDSFTYLSMELVKSENGWKILSYGLEK